MMTLLEQQRLTDEVVALRQENKLLRDKIDLLVRKVFGKSSEKLDDAQLMLLLQGEDEVPKKDPASSSDATGLEAELAKGDKELKQATKPRRERKLRIPEHLPVSETIVIEPDEVKADPQAWRKMGELVTEQLDYQTGKFTLRLIVRPKYVRIDQPYEAPVVAALPTLQDKGIAAPGLMAQVIVSKYCNHLPLYRQEQMYRLQHRIELPRQSMARWIEQAAHWLRPIYERIHTGVLDGGYVQADETMVEYLKPGNGETKQGYFWTLKRPAGDSVFVWRTSRSAEALGRIIPADFSGFIGADGYTVYQIHAAKSDGRIRIAACWAHVRRKFDEAKAAYPVQAGAVLLLIQRLYRIEKHLRENAITSAKLRSLIRQQQSRTIIERLGALLQKWRQDNKFLPKSLMGQAISYTLTLWPMLQEYVEHGQLEIDNNLVEPSGAKVASRRLPEGRGSREAATRQNAIRPTAVGKKNYPSFLRICGEASLTYAAIAARQGLFIGEAAAGQTSAILFTIIEACRRRQIDPWEYLRHVLTRLPRMTNQQIDEVMPDAWAATQKQAKQSNPPDTAHESQAAA
jgi:transposase